MTDKRRSGLFSTKLVAIAAVAGIVAGAAAVYVRETTSGNAETAQNAGPCAGSLNKARALEPFFKGDVAAMVPIDQPQAVEGLTFTDATVKVTSIADFAGKTTLVNLWATWCVPCREEMPALNGLQKALGSDRFQVVAINIDTGDAEKPKAFLAETGVDALGLYRDASMGVFNTLKKQGLAFGLPVTLLVDGKGCLLGHMNGPAAWDSPDARALITAATGA
ncbi:thiol:disulfide interchange protein TlpA [Rhizobium glycinendophyticum]|uniref:TlpA family protein disulfide reductase n=1 Tax=Rhizobium glycinendophyticum TaxID=2589807 RepID=A0A504U0H3_9HYPH|nr:TlpA disulfide reductase family protein [Rhizobium glycinendophyticum]TPP06987.1 TlpA family protein disulfide reductase [Rhizobium glycinendophyticum]